MVCAIAGGGGPSRPSYRDSNQDLSGLTAMFGIRNLLRYGWTRTGRKLVEAHVPPHDLADSDCESMVGL